MAKSSAGPSITASFLKGSPPGYAIDDDAAIHFTGTEVSEVVSGRVGAAAYRVELVGGQVVETPLNAQQIK